MMFYLIKHETRPVWLVGFTDSDVPIWGTRSAAERFSMAYHRTSTSAGHYFGLAADIGGRWVGPCDGTEE
jgi:hypothetical protein